MNKLKFKPDEGSVFYKELTTAVNHYFSSNQLAKHGNRTMHIKIAAYLALDLLFYTLAITSTHLALFYLFYLLTGLCVLLTAFNISHDAAHGVAVKSKYWNNFLFQLSFNLQGNNAYVWGKHHNESHHLYTNVEGSDIDVLHNPLIRMTDTQQMKWYHRHQHLYAPLLYLLYSLNWFLFRETLMLFGKTSRTIEVRIPRREIVKLIFFKLLYIFYTIAVPALVLPFGFWPVLLAFVLNHFLVSLIFTAVLGVSHLSDYVTHPKSSADGSMNMSWPKLQLQTSADYNSSSVFFNWTLGGFNAHALHHLLPNICHVHYLSILPIFRELCKKHRLTYIELDYKQALAAHFRFLKKMGHQEVLEPRNYEPAYFR